MDYKPLLDASSLLSKLSDREVEAVEHSLSIIGTGGALPDLIDLHRTSEDVAIEKSIRELLSSCDHVDGQFTLRERTSIKRSVPAYWPHAPQLLVTPLHVLNFLANALIKKKYKFGVVLTARNEGRYITEWLIHYKLLGADKFIIYYNDTNDGMVELLEFLAPMFNITILDNSSPAKASPQLSAYGHAIQALREVHECEWVAFLDADEFLFFDPGFGNVNDAIAHTTKAAGHEIQNICVNWRWFVSINTFSWKPGRTTTRFSNCFPHSMKKCMFRPQYALSLERVHFPTLISGAKSVTPDGQDIANIALDTYDTCSNVMFLNHYFTRSFEEFALKTVRGAGNAGDDYSHDFAAFHWGVGPELTRFTPPKEYRVRFEQQYSTLSRDNTFAALEKRCVLSAREELRAIQTRCNLAAEYNRLLGIATD